MELFKYYTPKPYERTVLERWNNDVDGGGIAHADNAEYFVQYFSRKYGKEKPMKEALKDCACIIDNSVYIKNVIFNGPATIILWSDGTKTVVKCMDGDEYDKEKGFAMAVCKKVMGDKYRKMFRVCEE